jgi:phage FluMu protein gp41
LAEAKYFVFKVEDDQPGQVVEDAVVIRRQDIIAPGVFQAYASSAALGMEILERVIAKIDKGMTAEEIEEILAVELENLERSHDFFMNQAEESEKTQRKMPD